ncbi:unnamed protein product [Didymodactylos carnosus]|uniref:Uncharacterized protein n=1 Tax=Didymodactylos carnosus TaxID=1234261 RepID=A0A815JIW8_9BILA|nr:unnamed protein product [Didymodactylos carnosus]CAF1382886.1 unnamed protein product [Didymodactylos carnosus]CAF4012439.1 unnamed protein product [Didymodactylos carnosus]CAF4278063.1 unnamed protein product [Didymodactylos carnosus]
MTQCTMALPNAQDEYLWKKLTSNEVRSINCSVFVAASPRGVKLPDQISPEAAVLLAKLKGRIYAIALRGKSQAGKSTTLNRVAKMSDCHINTLLPVAKQFGSTTTHGIWIMIVEFKNDDALLLFDMQGTDRGADEITYKLIAYTDHICTKVVNVFRMPQEGFSNEYIDALYCLATARESVKNLAPTSDKVLLWTNCVLPKQSPFDEKSCETPEVYQAEVLKSVEGERKIQARKAIKYTEQTPIVTSSKPSDKILSKISELENDNSFIQNDIVPVLKRILHNVRPVTISSHDIKGGNDYVQYLSNVYSNILKSDINLPFCILPMVRNIATSVSKIQAEWMKNQIEQLLPVYSQDPNWISNILIIELNGLKSKCIEAFKRKLSDFPDSAWKDQLDDLDCSIQVSIKKVIDKYRKDVLDHFLKINLPRLSHVCTLGLRIDELKSQLIMNMKEIDKEIVKIPLLNESITDLDRRFVTQALEMHIHDLCRIQENNERDWTDRERKFKEKIYSTDHSGVDEIIKLLIGEHMHYSEQQFTKFGIIPQPFFNLDIKTDELKKNNKDQSKIFPQKYREECIEGFKAKIGSIFSTNATTPEKYGFLLIDIEYCLKRYYEKLPWPLNDETIGQVESDLQGLCTQALDNIYTPEVIEQLKRDRVAQMEALSKLKLAENESLLWVHCVGCKRIFAGRTVGCANVTCSQFQVSDTMNTDHGCSLTFQWKKAQPVKFDQLPKDIWLLDIEGANRGDVFRKKIRELQRKIILGAANLPKLKHKRTHSR